MFRKLTAAILSVILLSPGWLGATGLTLPFALVPLLWISSSYDASRRSWRRMFGWAALTFALWNVATVWWIWNATPVGPVAATLASTFFNMIAFMLFHTVSKKGPKALAYTLLVAGWIATEYWYTVGEFSWPWLILGNGFSHEAWLVQWYEYTGVFGGSLWVLLCNILFFMLYRSLSAFDMDGCSEVLNRGMYQMVCSQWSNACRLFLTIMATVIIHMIILLLCIIISSSFNTPLPRLCLL